MEQIIMLIPYAILLIVSLIGFTVMNSKIKKAFNSSKIDNTNQNIIDGLNKELTISQQKVKNMQYVNEEQKRINKETEGILKESVKTAEAIIKNLEEVNLKLTKEKTILQERTDIAETKLKNVEDQLNSIHL